MKQINLHKTIRELFSYWCFIALLACMSFTSFAQGPTLNIWHVNINNGPKWFPGNDHLDYAEGDVVPFMATLPNLSGGTSYSLEVSYDATKGTINAYDNLAYYYTTEATLPQDAAYTDFPSSAFSILNGSITSVTAQPDNVTPHGTISSYIIVFSVSNTGSQDVSLRWGGHLAVTTSSSDGAGKISGAPYHMNFVGINGSAIGQRDRSVMVKQADPVCTPPDVSDASITLCETTAGSGTASFDLTSVSASITTDPNATIEYYSDVDLTNQITSPYTAGNNTVVYAKVIDGDCFDVAYIYLYVNPLPTVYTLTGTSLCSTATGAGTLTLSGSQVGVNYQLYNSASQTAVQNPKAGTGFSLTWSGLATGSYYVVATNSTTSCNSTTTSATVTVYSCAFTATKGFWSSTGKDCKGKTAISILQTMITSPVVFGISGKSFTLKPSDLFSITETNCSSTKLTYIPIQKMLPGGSTPDVLRNDVTYQTFASWSTLVSGKTYSTIAGCKTNNYGSIVNNLLAQTMALYFNLTYSSNLGSIVLYGNMLKFAPVACNANTPDLTKPSSTCIPLSVWNYLATGNPKSTTIKAIYDLANYVLGQSSPSTGISASDMTAALNAINVGFDQGKALTSTSIGSCSAVLGVSVNDVNIANKAEITQLTVSTYPNPFRDKVMFSMVSPVSGKASLDVYNIMGQKLHNVYQGYLFAGRSQVIEYNVPSAFKGALIYTLKVGDQQVNGKVVQIK